MALDTVADYIARARNLLQDEVEPYRYEDSELVTRLNEGIQESRRVRPDLWLSTFRGQLPSYDVSLPSTVVAIDPMYRMAFAYYMAGTAQLSDNEDTQDERAMAFLGKFTTTLSAG